MLSRNPDVNPLHYVMVIGISLDGTSVWLQTLSVRCVVVCGVNRMLVTFRSLEQT